MKQGSQIKLLVVAGARPNFMKIKPFMKAISEFNAREGSKARYVDVRLVHTGQHYDENMSEVFFRELGIQPPDINLGVGSGSHAVQTANIMTGFEAVCEREKPDWAVVVGDVNSTMACTLVCAKMSIQVAHIEAGLRSHDRTMPEEINRVVTDTLADLLLTPSADADENLLQEGISKDRIKLVGNIMIDSLVDNLPTARSLGLIAELDLKPAGFVYVTLHRPSNVDNKASLTAIMKGMQKISQRLPIVFPVHPRTRKMLSEFDLMRQADTKLLLLEPIGYHGSLCLAENARLVLTDSGGLQEEATYFRTPCLTLRPNTERPITITLGSNRLTRIDALVEDVNEVLDGPERKGQIPPLWDGHTAERILRSILEAPPI
jgi:UDP-N-acetylglucosamine 2-epimerase (non-hydrolysing)